ncbi:MAG: response regulator [Bacteroidales bacterium]|nr:response regulator [Bacteroidales bacterium]
MPNILIIDDNPSNLKLMSIYSEELGLIYDTCSSGKEALDVVKHKNFDIVLIDIEMPEMNGAETAFHMRAWQLQTGQIFKILAMSAHDKDWLKKFNIDKYFDGMLEKPYTIEKLESLVK